MIREAELMPWEAKFPTASVASMLRYGGDTLAFTRKFYEVRQEDGQIIMAAGVAIWSMVRPPELWVMPAKPYFVNLRSSLRTTRAAMALPVAQFPGLVCEVERDNAVELHFVKFMGWVESGRRSIRPNGERFIQFKVKE